MQTIEVTDSQHTYITRIREELSRTVVGRYGTSRDCDAIQFLIDNLDDDLDLQEAFDADALPDGTEISFEEPEIPDGTDDATGTDGADENADGAHTGDDDEMLDRMMNLLETHDDKWEKSPAADYRYRVELADGGTEDVQTKDDVKAILFREY